jgi:hypothetical protein
MERVQERAAPRVFPRVFANSSLVPAALLEGEAAVPIIFLDEFIEAGDTAINLHTPAPTNDIGLAWGAGLTVSGGNGYVESGGSNNSVGAHSAITSDELYEGEFYIGSDTLSTDICLLMFRGVSFVGNRWQLRHYRDDTFVLREGATTRLSQTQAYTTGDTNTMKVTLNGDTGTFYFNDVLAFSGSTYSVPSFGNNVGVYLANGTLSRCNWFKVGGTA